MNTEKRKKLAIVVLPAIAILGGMLLFNGRSSGDEKMIENDGSFGDIEVEDKSGELTKKTEVYKNYFDETNKKEWLNKSSNNQDFFSEDVIEVKEEEIVLEEDSIDEEMIAEPKIVYVEKPVEKKGDPEPPKRRRRTWDEIYEDGLNSTAGEPGEQPLNSDETITAVIHNDQEVKSGGRVTIRITKDVVIGGMVIPRNTFVYGIASLSDERVFVKVNSLDVGGRRLSRSFILYDASDDMEGLFIPGGLQQESARDVAGDVLSTIEPVVSVPILGGVSVKTAKKKVDEPSVKLRSGHKIVIR
jgi:hypothetical protein